MIYDSMKVRLKCPYCENSFKEEIEFEDAHDEFNNIKCPQCERKMRVQFDISIDSYCWKLSKESQNNGEYCLQYEDHDYGEYEISYQCPYCLAIFDMSLDRHDIDDEDNIQCPECIKVIGVEYEADVFVIDNEKIKGQEQIVNTWSYLDMIKKSNQLELFSLKG